MKFNFLEFSLTVDVILSVVAIHMSILVGQQVTKYASLYTSNLVLLFLAHFILDAFNFGIFFKLPNSRKSDAREIFMLYL
jgi:hypothetical protein